jgi:hypothetical protein
MNPDKPAFAHFRALLVGAILLVAVGMFGLGYMSAQIRDTYAERSIFQFRACLEPEFFFGPYKRSRNSASMQRAVGMLAREADCAKVAGLHGYTPADIDRQTGFSIIPPRPGSPVVKFVCLDGDVKDFETGAFPRCAI